MADLRIRWVRTGAGALPGSSTTLLEEAVESALRERCDLQIMNASDVAALGDSSPAHSGTVTVLHVEDLPGALAEARQLNSCADIVFFHDVHFRSGEVLEPQMFRGARALCAPWERSLVELRRLAELMGAPPQLARLMLPYSGTLAAKNPKRDARRVAFSGSARVEHRAAPLLEALSRAGEKWTLDWMVSPEDLGHARHLAATFQLTRVEFHTTVTRAAWRPIVERCSVAAHPLVSVHGNPSPLLADSFASGAVIAVSDFGAATELPLPAVSRVRPGYHESDDFRSIFERADSPASRAQRERGQLYAADVLSPGLFAAELAALANQVVYSNSTSPLISSNLPVA